MSIFQKNISIFLIGGILCSFSTSFALTNKESVTASINTLNTSITTSIVLKEKTLSDRANELGDRYDATIKSLWFQPDEIEALTSIKKLAVPSFRQDIAQAYLDLKQNILQDIKTSQTSLATLRDEVALGYTTLSDAQKQSYDAKIADIRNTYTTFLSGSSSSIDSFTATFSGRILSDTELVKKMMQDNGEYILFIRDIRSIYGQLEGNKAQLLLNKETLDKQILPKIQGGFSVFSANKKMFTDVIRNDLTSGLVKAMVAQERIKKQETELRAYIEDIMNKWNEYLAKNFWQDEELLSATKDTENILVLEKELHDKIYDSAGNIQSLNILGSGALLADIAKINSNLANVSAILSSLIATYGTGNTLGSLNDKLTTAYKAQILAYRADFTKLLENRLNNVLLDEKNHSQTLTLIDQEEQILKQNLWAVVSADFTEQLIKSFNTKILALAKTDGRSDTLKKVQMLMYRYNRIVTQKKIDSTTLVPYYGIRASLDSILGNIFLSLENKVGKDVLLVKFPLISDKINVLLGTNLSAKNRYTLLVVQSNILKYLEDATK